jgi:spore germination cell wall hydrolase CwlJ-like protein
VLLCAVLLVATAAVISRSVGSSAAKVSLPDRSAAVPQATVTLKLPPPDLVHALTPEQAVAENAKRAFAERPDSPAAAFLLKAADMGSRERALECLTQAVYYEAATEGVDGGRAVAQVVLNRMRHPAYPSSVCGVVYQGSERTTGCQFTFTCDGSLARPPARYLWDQARRIASEALAGKVFAPVGHATHYHADYVLPFWADSLDKSRQIGRHIFYRLKGSLGSSAFFRQGYAGREPLPPLPASTDVALDALSTADDLLAAEESLSGLAAPTGNLVAMAEPIPDPLIADAEAGRLILDGDQPRPKPSAKRTAEACPAESREKQLRAIAANDLRALAAGQGC